MADPCPFCRAASGDVDTRLVASEALRVWKATGGDPEGFQGPAYGFSAERRERWQAPAHLGDHGMREVKA